MKRKWIMVRVVAGLLAAWGAGLLASCASESDVQSAQAALGGDRAALPATMGSVSADELARLMSPDPVPPPAYPTPPVESETTLSSAAYQRALASTTDPLTALVVRINASTPSSGGSILDTTTLAGPGPRARRLFAADGVECAGGSVSVGAIVLTHVAAGDAAPSAVARPTPIRHSVLGGAIAGFVEARTLSADAFEVSFPWGLEVVRAAELGGAL